MKPIKHENLSHFRISETGAIVSSKGKLMQTRMHPSGYLVVGLDGKVYFVHKLVAMTYIPNPLAKDRVMHFDGNKINNYVDNLFYADSNNFKELQIRYLYGCGNSIERIAKVYELSNIRIYKMVKS
jgi:hypothetical protein